MVFFIIFLWYGIFKNWRIRIMEMRQGRWMAFYNSSVVWTKRPWKYFCRYFCPRNSGNPAAATSFIGHQVKLWAEYDQSILINFSVLQLWGCLGSVTFCMVFFFHPVFFVLGILGHFPDILTDVLWPRLRTILLGLLSVQGLTLVMRPVANFFLVLVRFWYAFLWWLWIWELINPLCNQFQNDRIVHQRLFASYDVRCSREPCAVRQPHLHAVRFQHFEHRQQLLIIFDHISRIVVVLLGQSSETRHAEIGCRLAFG